MKTAYCYVPSPGHAYPGHPESPERFDHFDWVEKMVDEGELAMVEVGLASEKDILRAHTPLVLETLQKAEQEAPVIIDGAPTYVARGSTRAALLAAGGTLAVTRAVMDGSSACGLALVRPPGHHAEYRRSMGFCMLNNIAIAVLHALAAGADRVLVVDFDAHHGNGTEDILKENKRAGYLSTHQYGIYPGTGGLTSMPDGRGRVVNIPLPVYAGDKAILDALEQAALPLADKIKPEILFVSAGFDAHWKDPLTALGVSTAGFYQICQKLVDMAGAFSMGKAVFVLEGGYHPLHLAENTAAMAAAVTGRPLGSDSAGPCPYPDVDIQPILDRVREYHHL